MPKPEEKWERLTSVPDRLEGKRRLAMEFLLRHSSGVAVCYAPKGRSKYRVRFDDGVYKGEYVFTIHQDRLTPLGVYLMCENTGWPGFKLHWLEDLAEAHMTKKMEERRAEDARIAQAVEERKKEQANA